MERPAGDNDPKSSNLKQFLVMLGLTVGCILAAWLLVEALEFLM